MAVGFGGASSGNSDVLGPRDEMQNPNASSEKNQWMNRTAYGGQATTYNAEGGVTQKGGADLATERYQGLGASANNRGAYGQDFGDYLGGMSQGNADRGLQTDAAMLSHNAAVGNAPSQAENLSRNMLDQSLAQQMAAASSARGGPLAQASAQNAAASAAAGQRQQGINSIAAMRADEMARARDVYGNQAGAMRGQDLSAAGLGLQKTGLQTQNELAQRQMNQQANEYYEGLGNQVQEDQMQAMGREHQIAEQGWEKQADIAQHSQDRDTSALGGLIGGVGGAIASFAAHGGPTHHEQAYLVGEEGPELIVPRHDGFVFTAPQTEFIRQTMTPEQKRALGGGIAGHRAFGGGINAFGATNDPTGGLGGKNPMGQMAAMNHEEFQGSRMGGGMGGYARATGGIVTQNPYGNDADIVRKNPYGEDPAKKKEQQGPSNLSKAFSSFSSGIAQGMHGPNYGVGVQKLAHGGSIAGHMGVAPTHMRRAPTMANAMAGVEALKTRMGHG